MRHHRVIFSVFSNELMKAVNERGDSSLPRKKTNREALRNLG